jgi:(1->4)-alpha-D-glucan 1-alpha-D-glucosylmutase
MTPTATYRLQFREGMTLARAAALVPYLSALGVSHLYTSPLFTAIHASTHGYDGIDFERIDPALGGEEGFNFLCAALKKASLGLVLDFVPNHMAASEENLWWRSVLEWGPESPFAAFFDIDWSAPKLLLPILGVSYGEALRDGTLGVAFDAATGSFSFTCYERHLPLSPPSYVLLLAMAGDETLSAIGHRFAAASREQAEGLKAELVSATADARSANAVAEAVFAAITDSDRLDAIHEAQCWRLAHWRLGREALTYRRFFEIGGLVGLRVEEPAVFDAVHARLFSMIYSSQVTGVRIDHIDGLADPQEYLERLTDAVPYLLVEKIVQQGEELPLSWPVAGTTGYEFIAALADLFIDRTQDEELTNAYDTFVGASVDYRRAAASAKRDIFERNLAAELTLLTEWALLIASADPRTRDVGRDSLRRAIVELAVALPVYRSYVGADGISPADRAVIELAAADARLSGHLEDPAALPFVTALVLKEAPGAIALDAASVFTARFQQSTAAVMAKGIEDTIFFRYNRLIALNEVGGAPDRYGAPLECFHEAMAKRQRTQPGGLSTTSTHDTKRGEDARARIYALSEMPRAWRDGVARWSLLNEPFRCGLPTGSMPEPAMEWLFYQALAGSWPAEWVGRGIAMPGELDLTPLRLRMLAFMEKAIREAKVRTSWTNIDEAYERAVAEFVTAVLNAETGAAFLADFALVCRPVWIAGAINSLSQLAVKLCAPGVPDIYQGTELWDFSLVDPDNRRPVDFDTRQAMSVSIREQKPETLLAEWTTGAPKLALLIAGLGLRNAHPALFAGGNYVPLQVLGPRADHIVAFARVLEDSVVTVALPRFVVGLSAQDLPLVPAKAWGDTVVLLPEAIRRRRMHDVVTGATLNTGSHLIVSEALARFPVGLLSGHPGGIL